jgi:hypothetical protein
VGPSNGNAVLSLGTSGLLTSLGVRFARLTARFARKLGKVSPPGIENVLFVFFEQSG